MSELYDIEFIKQDILKQDRIKQAKEKALEDERKEQERIDREQAENRRQAELARISEENRKRAGQEALEATERATRANSENTPSQSNETAQTTQPTTSSTIGSDWSQVSPEQASAYMSARTPIPASKWASIIYAESTNNPTVTNPQSGTFGYLQLHPVHGNVSGMTPQQYLDTAVGVYNSQGLSAWEVTTNGMIN